MLKHRRAAAGFSLIELMIVVAILALVMMIGLPNVAAWIQNTQLKTGAEGLISGLQLARAEALRRNASVRFQLVTSVVNGCALSANGANWVVSLANPAGLCGVAISDAVAPQLIQRKSSAEGSPNAALSAFSAPAVPADTAVFNGLGRLTGLANMIQINVRNPSGGKCLPPVGAGSMRCFSLMIGTAGQVRMCDPAVANATDPRACGADWAAF